MANIELISREANVAKLKVEINAEETSRIYQQLYRELAKEINLPGFRKGKVPANVLQRHVGMETINGAAADNLKDYAIDQALEQSNLSPRGNPQWLNEPEPVEGAAITYELSIPVLPEVALPDFASYEIAVPALEVTDEMKSRFRERLAERYTEYPAKDGAAGAGDALTVAIKSQYKDSSEDAPFAVERMMYVIGQEGNLPGWDERLIGQSAGAEQTFDYPMPEDFADQRIAGKTLTVELKVQEVNAVNRPAIDEEFIKAHFSMDSQEQFDKFVDDSLNRERDQQAVQMRIELAMQRLVSELTAEITEDMITEEIDGLVKENDHNLHHYNSSLEEYLKQKGQTLAEYRESLREPALQKIKHYLAIRTLAEQEHIHAHNEDYQRYAMLLIQREGIPPEKVTELFRNRDFFNEATYQIIKEKAHALVGLRVQVKVDGAADAVAEAAPAEDAVPEAE
jgi:trigger factor